MLEIGKYSNFLHLEADQGQWPEVQKVLFIICVFASAANSKAATRDQALPNPAMQVQCIQMTVRTTFFSYYPGT